MRTAGLSLVVPLAALLFGLAAGCQQAEDVPQGEGPAPAGQARDPSPAVVPAGMASVVLNAEGMH